MIEVFPFIIKQVQEDLVLIHGAYKIGIRFQRLLHGCIQD